MKMPHSFNIFGQTYKLKTKDGLAQTGIAGYMVPDKKIIVIDSSQFKDADTAMHTILHEFFHAVFHRCSFYQSINRDVEEILVDSMATTLVENFDIKFKK